jgi:hypothetical protein
LACVINAIAIITSNVLMKTATASWECALYFLVYLVSKYDHSLAVYFNNLCPDLFVYFF